MNYSDPAMVRSNYARNPKDRYWTAPWVTHALVDSIDFINPKNGTVYDPAAGRGDMVKALQERGFECLASDIDMSEFDSGLCQSWEADFLKSGLELDLMDEHGIVTNPPYGKLIAPFIQQSLQMMHEHNLDFVAMLLRSEYKSGKRRRPVFGGCDQYAGELVLTKRPLWDWWLPPEIDEKTGEPKEAHPRHNYSWFIWRQFQDGPPQQWFWYE